MIAKVRTWKADPGETWDERTASRFWSKVDKFGPVPIHAPWLGPCWLWTAGLHDGYGQFTINNVGQPAHRVSRAWEFGPSDLGLDHVCHDPHFCPGGECIHRRCVNPIHVTPTTARENNRRSNSWSGRNMAKTHCPYGHPYSGDNLILRPSGARGCRICTTESDRLRYLLWRLEHGLEVPA